MKLGFLGLGMMGTPMALNLARKFPLVVWNRSAAKYPPLIKAGATIGETPSKVVEQSSVIFTMLFDGLAIQSIFNEDFKQALRGKTLVNTSSVSVGFSHSLA
ncbi:putative 2-hydroxy-3-oxopropionate reductase protein [Ilyonectria robusta]